VGIVTPLHLRIEQLWVKVFLYTTVLHVAGILQEMSCSPDDKSEADCVALAAGLPRELSNVRLEAVGLNEQASVAACAEIETFIDLYDRISCSALPSRACRVQTSNALFNVCVPKFVSPQRLTRFAGGCYAAVFA